MEAKYRLKASASSSTSPFAKNSTDSSKRYDSHFINLKLTTETVYTYSIRKLIQKALDTNIHLFKGVVLDLGCGEMPYRQYLLDNNKSITKYIGVDLPFNSYHEQTKPDMTWNGSKIKLPNGSIDTVIATELFEHVQNLDIILKEIFRVLSPNGKLFFTVPFIWPLHETPHDEYRYTPYSLERYIKAAGFRKINIAPLGGYSASLAQMLCIWTVNFRADIKSSLKRKFFEVFEKRFLYFIIEKLLESDEKKGICNYKENSIFPGFYGYAEK